MVTAARKGRLMTALVLIFCLQSAPGSCTEERPVLDLPLAACLARGQHYAQEWLADHPKWALSGWRCEYNLPRQRPA
jgi:hypothetical protein